MIHYEILMQPHFYSSIIGDYGSRHFLAICYATSTYLLFRISSPFLVHIYNAMLPTSFCIQRSLFRKKSRFMSLSKVHWFVFTSYIFHAIHSHDDILFSDQTRATPELISLPFITAFWALGGRCKTIDLAHCIVSLQLNE